MKIFWMDSATQDRQDIFDYISEDNFTAAEKMDVMFIDAVEGLALFPFMGRPGLIPGTLELVPHHSYRIVYEVTDDALWIMAIVHTARNWPLEK
ncbi:type II toxin-antitoxin system RelE/ParE family toxin [Salmonella enterica]|uniref:Type II toxin-antitoxin system RelE/ParE family toxin n=1 Tax=Salmonella enterica TaxID=28901 RepID=A0A402TQ33_SALER|nr:type II toxin-antitoxin system RelE/ParE family toxin [Salmonella enterica]EAQ0896187.1 type II toxin-antitoxin system RelE/ParE family toxin [Salmonella enterica]EAQ7631561.1 type II toxin-antitoxin system RelE/ParE family toxin [Salmonella enterica]EAX1173151.1 type II toxin-antitoxin system RelE/ParE family toxin [Salmonella enterica]EAX3208024.1 type II toxin-antitoxin system RelE/ParE family toxin [Salmonella enterica]